MEEHEEPCFDPAFKGIEPQECPTGVKTCVKSYMISGDAREYQTDQLSYTPDTLTAEDAGVNRSQSNH